MGGAGGMKGGNYIIILISKNKNNLKGIKMKLHPDTDMIDGLH